MILKAPNGYVWLQLYYILEKIGVCVHTQFGCILLCNLGQISFNKISDENVFKSLDVKALKIGSF